MEKKRGMRPALASVSVTAARHGTWQGAAAILREAANLVALYPRTAVRGLRERPLFESVESCCLFVGYPRSGHTLVASLLDANPDAVIAHELDVLKYAAAGFTRAQICSLALDSSREFTRSGNVWTGYTYEVPGQWQGRERRIRVVGDKHGALTSERLAITPGLLERLERALRVPVRVVHVIRNPYDGIATQLQRDRALFDRLDEVIDYWFWLCDSVRGVKQRIGDRMLDIRHEEFVVDPRAHLTRLCAFLGLEPTEDWLAACAAIVFEKPRRSRDSIEWTADQIASVAERMKDHPFLAGYSFQD
jgi:hypothetical protein